MAIESQVLGIAPALIMALLVISYTVYVVQDMRFRLTTQVEYETAFLERNRLIISEQCKGLENKNKPIPLTFPDKDAATLVTLCKRCISAWFPTHYRNRWNSREYKPSIELLTMRFRRIALARTPLRVEAIRCGEKYAVIEAGDGFSGYVLLRDETYEDSNVEMFKIYTKFQYKRRISRVSQPDNQGRKNV